LSQDETRSLVVDVRAKATADTASPGGGESSYCVAGSQISDRFLSKSSGKYTHQEPWPIGLSWLEKFPSQQLFCMFTAMHGHVELASSLDLLSQLCSTHRDGAFLPEVTACRFFTPRHTPPPCHHAQ
jgi:hypothetical protein